MSAADGQNGTHGRSGKSLLSHSSILIFSSFLIGVAVRRVFPPAVEVYVLAAGAVGLLSYLGLDIAAARRRERQTELAEQQAANQLQGRLNRHLSPKTQHRSARDKSADEPEWQQYVTVSDGH